MAYPIYNTPTPEQVNIERSRKMAEMLRQQAQDPLQGQMVSGHYVGPSWTQGLAKILAGWKSGKLQDEADEKQKAYDTGAESSMGEIQKMYSDPNANDEQRNAAFMAHSQKYGGRGIDTYLQAQNATTQMRNAATAAENARRKSEKISQDAEQGTGFLKALFPGAAFKQNVGGEDYDVDYMGLDEQGNPVNQVQPMTVGFDQEAARTFGFDDEAMGRIMSVAQKDPKLASRIALEEYKRLSKGKSEAKDVLAKERAMAEAMNMPVGDYLRHKMTKQPLVDMRGASFGGNASLPSLGEAQKTAGKEFGKFAQGAVESAQAAYDVSNDIDMVVEGLKGMGGGPVAEFKAWAGQVMPAGTEWSNMASMNDLAKTVQTKLAPTMRVAGSGATSDFEMKAFMAAIPSLSSTEQGRSLMAKYAKRVSERAQIRAEVINDIEQSGRLPTPREIAERMQSRVGKTFFDSADRAYFKMKPASTQPAAQPAAQQAAPQSGVRKYNPATGRIE